MRTLLLFTLIAFGSAINAQSLYDNFDTDRTSDYGLGIPFPEQQGNGIGGTVWPGWHGTFLEFTINPATDGINSSAMCAEYTRNPGEFYDVLIVHPGDMDDVTDYITGAKSMSFDVYSPVPGITVQITLENQARAEGGYPEGRHSEYTAVTTTGGEWETLEFTLAGEPWSDAANGTWWPDATTAHNDVDRMVILFNPASNTGDTFYLDNIMGPERVSEPCDEVNADESILFNADCEHDRLIKNYSDGRLSTFQDPLGENGRSYEYARNGGAADDVLILDFNGPLNIPSNSTFKIDILDANAPSSVLLSFQDAFGLVIQDFTTATFESDAWHTFSFDLAALAGAPNVESVVVLFDAGDLEADTYYFDNVLIETIDGIEEVAIADFTLFPNPAEGYIQLQSSANIEKVQILDNTGRTVLEQEENLAAKINTTSLTSGIYFVKAILASGTVQTQTLIVR